MESSPSPFGLGDFFFNKFNFYLVISRKFPIIAL